MVSGDWILSHHLSRLPPRASLPHCTHSTGLGHGRSWLWASALASYLQPPGPGAFIYPSHIWNFISELGSWRAKSTSHLNGIVCQTVLGERKGMVHLT